MLRALVAVSALALPFAACASRPASSSASSTEPPSAPAVLIAPDAAASPASGSASGAAAAPTSSATSTNDADEATSAPTNASAKPELEPSTCAKRAVAADKACHWSVVGLAPCRGAAIPRGYAPTLTPTCVCNGCETDADCTTKPRGRCETFHHMCSVSAKACVYPGDLCADGGALCGKQTSLSPGTSTSFPKECTHDGHGHAVCGPYVQPPP